MQQCEVCLDEDCGGKKNCHCDTCKNSSTCPKFLAPIIRITRKCTQSCSHCCYSCSPKAEEMMSVETAKDVKKFLDNNIIFSMTLMGGEFFCNPYWKEIFDILIPGMAYVRLVTAGDWAGDKAVPEFLKKFDCLKVSISKDPWHSNKNVEAAVAACKRVGLRYNLPTDEETTDESVVPVGRGSLSSYGLYSMFSCYCHNPIRKYAFLIDEVGKIYKCGFGVWDYAEVGEYLDGGFAERFKEFNKKFYGCFIPSCASCNRSYTHNI